MSDNEFTESKWLNFRRKFCTSIAEMYTKGIGEKEFDRRQWWNKEDNRNYYIAMHKDCYAYLFKTKNGYHIRWKYPLINRGIVPTSRKHSGNPWINLAHIYMSESRVGIACEVNSECLAWGDYGTGHYRHVIGSHSFGGAESRDVQNFADARHVARQALANVMDVWGDLNRRTISAVQIWDHCSGQRYASQDVLDSYGFSNMREIPTDTLEEIAASVGFRSSSTPQQRMTRAFARGPEIARRRREKEDECYRLLQKVS